MMLLCKVADLVEVNGFCVFADAVGNDVVQFAGEVDRGAMGQMPAVGEIHGEDCVAGLKL